MTNPEIVVEAIRPKHVLHERRQFIRTTPTGSPQALNAKLRHLRTSLAEAEAAEQAAEKAADEIEARRGALRAERVALAAQIEADDLALARGDITVDEAASRQARLAAVERAVAALPAVVRERTDDASDARAVARGRRDDVQFIKAGMALAAVAKSLNTAAPAIREYLNSTGDAALVIRLADLAADAPDEPENRPTSTDDEGGGYVPTE